MKRRLKTKRRGSNETFIKKLNIINTKKNVKMPTCVELYAQLQERQKLRDEKYKMEKNEKRRVYDYVRDEMLMKEEERREKIDAWRIKRAETESFSDKIKREEKEEEDYNKL